MNFKYIYIYVCVWRFSEQNRIPFSIAMKFINDRGLEDIGVYMIT